MHQHERARRNVKASLVNSIYYLDNLADFGLSKQITHADQRLKTFCGTPYYLAPEIVQMNKQVGYSKEVDWWAVGILMFELLVGSPPFTGDNLSQRRVFPDAWARAFGLTGRR